MVELFSRIFIKNYQDIKNPAVRKSYGTMSSIVGIATNFVLAAVKLLAGVWAASVAIVADALNNLSDAGSSVITLISFKISSKPADKDHPFGHARIEYVASMIVSFLILLVGAELMIDSAKTLLGLSEAAPTEISTLTIIILSVSIFIKLWLGLFNKTLGKKIDSSVIQASAADSLSDAVSTAAVLASAIIIKFTNWYLLDAIAGLGVSILIIIAGAKILNETKNAILGEAPVDELVESIRSIVTEFPEVIGMHDLLVHNYGPNKFLASLHAEVDGKGDIYYLHDVIDNIEKKINEELNILCTIHLDPIVTDDETVNELRIFLTETMAEYGLNLSVHDFRVVIGETHINLIFDIVLPFEYKLSEIELKERICRAVSAKRSNCYCVITVDRG